MGEKFRELIPKTQEIKEEGRKLNLGETLETAFNIDKEHEPIVDKETAETLKFREMAAFLIGGRELYEWWRSPSERYHTREEEKKEGELQGQNYDAETFDRILQHAPENPEVIKLRQEMLVDLVGSGPHEKKEKLDFLNKLRELESGFYRILNESLSLADHIEDYKANAELLEIFTGGRVNEFLEEFKKSVDKIPGQSKFFQELKTGLKTLESAIEKYKLDIQEANADSKLSRINELIERQRKGESIRKTRKDSLIKSDKEYRDLINKFSPCNRDEFEIPLSVLKNFDEFLICANSIIERGLKKVEIIDNDKDDTLLELHGAKSPILMADRNVKKVVPFDIKATKDKPIVIVTGDNATGKSKLVDAISIISPVIQSTGFGPVESGRYRPRKEVARLHSLTVDIDETQYSRGQKEMVALSNAIQKIKNDNILEMDEFLTSTDSVGAISIVLAVLEKNAKKGGISFLTIHSRDLEKIQQKEIAPLVKFIRAKAGEKGEKTYQWEEGIGRANPVKLAKECGLSDDILKRAKEIQDKLEGSEK